MSKNLYTGLTIKGLSGDTNILEIQNSGGTDSLIITNNDEFIFSNPTDDSAVIKSYHPNNTASILDFQMAVGGSFLSASTGYQFADISIGTDQSYGKLSINYKDFVMNSLNSTLPTFDIGGNAILADSSNIGINTNRDFKKTIKVVRGRTSYNAIHYGQEISITGSATASTVSNNTTYGLNILNNTTYTNSGSGDFKSVGISIDVENADINHGLLITGDNTNGIGTDTPTDTLHIKGMTGSTQFRLEESYTPTGSGDTAGNVGSIAWDDDYIYTKTNTGWGRSALDYTF